MLSLGNLAEIQDIVMLDCGDGPYVFLLTVCIACAEIRVKSVRELFSCVSDQYTVGLWLSSDWPFVLSTVQ